MEAITPKALELKRAPKWTVFLREIDSELDP